MGIEKGGGGGGVFHQSKIVETSPRAINPSFVWPQGLRSLHLIPPVQQTKTTVAPGSGAGQGRGT